MTNNIIITIDYETWHPACERDIAIMKKMGLKINWEEDIFNPTYKLLDCADKVGAKLTIMAEMGEYFWLKENNLEIAKKIAKQLQEVICRGHDVQLHLHPHWMPETGATCDNNGEWHGDIEYASANEYPYDLIELIGRCKKELESIICVVKPEYRVTCFRAGGYRVQPFKRLYEALVKNEIICDTSVFAKGKATDRDYDFSMCKDGNHPYYLSSNNPAVCDKNNNNMIEMPIYSMNDGKRWMMDGDMQEVLAYVFFEQEDSDIKDENFFVMVGHSKEKHNYDSLEKQWELLASMPQNKWITLNEAVEIAKDRQCDFEDDLLKKEDIIEVYKRIKDVSNNKKNLDMIIFLLWLKKNGCKIKRAKIYARGYKKQLIEIFNKKETILIDIDKENIYEVSLKEFMKNKRNIKDRLFCLYICIMNKKEL